VEAVIRRVTSLLLLLLTIRLFAASTTNNDDSCDITLAPAATLLLPLFDVAIPDPYVKTIFTVTNVTAVPQIAHVTIWTDWSFPILSFNLFLTGYDVQAIDLSDVLIRGIIAPPEGTSATDRRISPNPSSGVPGAVPDTYVSNPNIAREAVAFGGACSTQMTQIPPDLLKSVQTALTTGLYQGANLCDSTRVGGTHVNARGSITIDVVNTCTTKYPDDPQYLLKELLFDNALIGDYQDIHSDATAGNLAQGNPMVHIRAIPEGGSAGSHYGSNLPYTFYDRFTISLPGQRQRTFDRRQPLPSVFAARWIEGGVSGFNTSYKIWREGVVAGTQTCSKASLNRSMLIPNLQLIRFDERENSFGAVGSIICPCPPLITTLPAASRVSTTNSSVFPANGSAVNVSGWMYLNLNNGGAEEYSANGRTGLQPTPFAPPGSFTSIRASQNWVIASMSAQGRYSVDFDAAMLGNGCSPAAVVVSKIAPAANENPSSHVD
jgi:hypothetical protein